MAGTRETELSTSLIVNSLLADRAWTGTVTWAVMHAPPAGGHYADNTVHRPAPGLEAAVRRTVEAVRSFTDLDIREAPGDGLNADIRIFQADSLTVRAAEGVQTRKLGAWAFHPADAPAGGDIWIGSDIAGDLTIGNYGFRALLHEFGHALGLKQPEEPGRATLPAHMDGAEHSVMSARGVPGGPAGSLGIGPGDHATTFMPYDVAALQHLYGADHADNGDDWYGFDPAERSIHRTIWDGGGRDVYNFGAFITPVSIDLTPGGWSITGQEPLMNRTAVIESGASPVWARGAVHNASLHEGDWRSGIEHAIAGSDDDTLTGNDLSNRLVGREGDDVAFGGRGRDTIHGGPGDDLLDGGGEADWLVAQEGADTVLAAGGDDAVLGGRGADSIDGGSGADKADGGKGDDTLDGGDGRDVMKGAAGDDVVSGGGGDDVVLGGDGADRLDGGAGRDLLIGHDGEDTIRGADGEDDIGGAAGDDSLEGGDGADRVVTGIGNDTATGGAGADTLHGQAGDDSLSGGEGADSILGGGFADRLWGGLGDDHIVADWGHDTLGGGRGDDTLTGGLHGDLFVIGPGDGADTITDFTPGQDRLDVPDPEAALAGAAGTAAGALVTLEDGATTALLSGVALQHLSAADVL